MDAPANEDSPNAGGGADAPWLGTGKRSGRQDQERWLYLSSLLKQEGTATPFFSVEELEAALEEKLTLLREVEIAL